jgi:hypothetical protein
LNKQRQSLRISHFHIEDVEMQTRSVSLAIVGLFK